MEMTCSIPENDLTERDRLLTEANRVKLFRNRNLLLWYKKLYECMFSSVDDINHKRILEIGSGTSPLKLFYENVLTSDILDLPYLDYRFDCHEIDTFEPVRDGSLDLIAMTNVLHHVKDPLSFLVKAAVKLRPQGKVIMAEPYFSSLSSIIYKYFHHEETDFDIDEPVLRQNKSPLSSANIALAHFIFFLKEGGSERLRPFYEFSADRAVHYSSVAYMLTGGISHNFLIPGPLYKFLLAVDVSLARRYPKLFSSFFIMELTRK